jgi:hypothetical protein
MLKVQAIKDTFYAMLQSRIAALNPARTIVVRSVLRPGVLVPENELPGAAVDGIAPAETFCIRWAGLKVDAQTGGPHAVPLLTLGCEIRYASDGSAGSAAMDRGRTLATMDAELATVLTQWPLNATTAAVAEIPGGGASTTTPLASNVFWSEAVFAPVVARGERLERTAQLEVFGYGQ